MNTVKIVMFVMLLTTIFSCNKEEIKPNENKLEETSRYANDLTGDDDLGGGVDEGDPIIHERRRN